MQASPAGLWVEGLTVEYTLGSRRTRVLEDLSFRAEDGQLVLASGPSGCGKTTLLSVLAGLLRPTAGRACFAGIDAAALRGKDLLAYRRCVGVVFQSFNLIASLSALENIAAPLVLTGVRPAAARRRAMELLDEMSMAPHAKKRSGRLSGGQQQRVAFARALAHDPPLLLADEPTAHLDPEQVAAVLALIDRLRRPGRLVMVTTHDTRFNQLADAVLPMGQAFDPEGLGR